MPGLLSEYRLALWGLLFLTAGCSSDDTLSPFRSDGCSLFPDASVITRTDWCSCCFEHDLAYWRGGTEDERELADQRLAACVLERTGNEPFANLMLEGVRFGGSPYFYNWYRWGYGWPYERRYQALTPVEVAEADQLLGEYEQAPQGVVCRN